MINTLKKLFGIQPQADFRALLAQGAVILDVRSPDEFKGGHIKGSVNMPLQTLGNKLKQIPQNKPIITCCASGVRSGAARSMLKQNGFTEVYNGGGWTSLKSKIS